MKLRSIPISKYQTVHPFPWLFGREKTGDIKSQQLLDCDVASSFVYSGGLLIWVGESGNWDVAAEFSLKDDAKLYIRDEKLWNKAKSSQIIHFEENFRFPQEKEENKITGFF